MIKRKPSPLAACIGLLSVASLNHYSLALPQDGNNATVVGDATYTVDSATQATISAGTDSVIEFYTPSDGSSAFSISSGETLILQSTAGAVDVLADVIDSKPSEIFGAIEGDGNVSLYIRNASGVVFGQDASVLNVPALVATTNLFDNADFLNFASGAESLDTFASGGEIWIESLDIQGGDLIVVASKVEIDGTVESSGEFKIAIGEQVELALPSSGAGLLSVDIKQALTSGEAAGSLVVSGTSSVDVGSVDWQAAVNDPSIFAVNVQGVVKANDVTVGSDGAINIVGKGGAMLLVGELNAADGAADIRLLGDNIFLEQKVMANSIRIDLGKEASGIAKREAYLEVNDLVHNEPSVEIEGASGAFRHAINGFGDYTVTGENSGTAAFDPQGDQHVSFLNVPLLQAGGGDNRIVIEDGASIDTIIGGGNNDEFLIRGTSRVLDGSGGNDAFIMDGGLVTAELNGGEDVDTLTDVFLRDLAGEPTNVSSGQSSSDFVNSWVNIEQVNPATLPPPVPSVPDLDTSNLNASTPLFSNLNGSAVSGLQLVGDDFVNTPCGLQASASVGEAGVDASVPSVGVLDEDCFNTPEYVALLNTTIYFDNDSSTILPAAASKLDRVSGFVIESNQFREVSVSGHTDSNASNEYNLALSKRRADSAVNYMAEQGVDAALFKTYHYGEELPAVENNSPENLAKNRRVVVELKK